MRLFKNGVGRPSNEIKKKRRYFVLLISIVIISIVVLSINLIITKFSYKKLTGAVVSNKMSSNLNIVKVYNNYELTASTGYNNRIYFAVTGKINQIKDYHIAGEKKNNTYNLEFDNILKENENYIVSDATTDTKRKRNYYIIKDKKQVKNSFIIFNQNNMVRKIDAAYKISNIAYNPSDNLFYTVHNNKVYSFYIPNVNESDATINLKNKYKEIFILEKKSDFKINGITIIDNNLYIIYHNNGENQINIYSLNNKDNNKHIKNIVIEKSNDNYELKTIFVLNKKVYFGFNNFAKNKISFVNTTLNNVAKILKSTSDNTEKKEETSANKPSVKNNGKCYISQISSENKLSKSNTYDVKYATKCTQKAKKTKVTYQVEGEKETVFKKDTGVLTFKTSRKNKKVILRVYYNNNKSKKSVSIKVASNKKYSYDSNGNKKVVTLTPKTDESEKTTAKPSSNNQKCTLGKYYSKEKKTCVKYKVTKKDGKYYVDGIIIANKKYNLPKNYNPGVNSEAKNALSKMQAAALKDNVNISKIVSGFRSYKRQQEIYNNYVKKDGVAKANTYSAKPGQSEHQTGLAFDLVNLSQNLGQKKEGKWLAKNSYKYGFIIRYPKGKQNITGYMYEPWHVRYVGKTRAKKIYDSKVTLEEYYGIKGY